VRWHKHVESLQELRGGHSIKVAFVDPRSAATITHACGSQPHPRLQQEQQQQQLAAAGPGGFAASGKISVAQYWEEVHPELGEHLNLANSGLPCLAAYKPPHNCQGQFSERTYRTYPLGACTIVVKVPGGSSSSGGGAGGPYQPAKGRNPPQCAAEWDNGVPPWVWGVTPLAAGPKRAAQASTVMAATTAAPVTAGEVAGEGTLLATAAEPVVPHLQPAALAITSHAQQGLEDLIKAMQPQTEAQAAVPAITDEVYEVFRKTLSSTIWSLHNLIRGGSAQKLTNLAGRCAWPPAVCLSTNPLCMAIQQKPGSTHQLQL
jgi:hypothetical protein